MASFAIRHKPSGTWLPTTYKHGQRAGATHVDAPFEGTPRLFQSRVGAENCLRWWLGGTPQRRHQDNPSRISCGYGTPSRNPLDMEICEVELLPVPKKISEHKRAEEDLLNLLREGRILRKAL